MKASIILGLQFGDEGKGKTTDYVCSSAPKNSIVIRFSGGQQAGHHVQIGDLGHVHSSYGSGTLRGFSTYISEHCTFYPVSMWKERKALLCKMALSTPQIILHPLAKMTTPADVAFNRTREMKLQHGSCGLGVGATMKRNDTTGYKLYAADLKNKAVLKQKLKNIKQYYINQLDENEPGDLIFFGEHYALEMEGFWKSLEFLEDSISVQPYSFLRNFEHLIFEGSQGIMLDMDHGIFPNVTYANTTSKNAIEICKKLEVSFEEIECYYVTRSYQTRHGNGWMSDEREIGVVNDDMEINRTNAWQGKFRIGEIDYDLINHALEVDKIYSEGFFTSKILAVTCLDQRPIFEFDYSRLNIADFKVLESFTPESSSFSDKTWKTLPLFQKKTPNVW